MSDAASASQSRGPATSHVSTAEWQSFELRMRGRRAQRCLLNAETALATGSINAARDALEEARRLEAPAAEIARIESLIDQRTATAPVSRLRLSWRYAAAAAVVIAGAAFAGTTFLKPQPQSAASGSTQAVPAPPPAPAGVTLAVQNIPPASSTTLAEGTSGPDATQTPVETAEDVTAATDARIVDPVSTQAPGVPVARLEDATPAAIAALPPPDPPAVSLEPAPLQQAIITTPAPTPPAVDPVPELRAPQPESNAPAASPNASAIETSPAAEKPDVPPRDESAEIRAILAQYERAYSRLDPSLARSVWPGVDERALARAFGNLASQRVVLQRCDVTTEGNTAHAVCTGSATWTPKVGGGGARTQNRRWTFDLLKEGDAWQINRAVVR